MGYSGIIFDLDGVLCFTDRFHYQAWLKTAQKIHAPFDEIINRRLRGVSRAESLEIILEKCPKKFSSEEKAQLMEEKNNLYRSLLSQMTPADLPEATRNMLNTFHQAGIRLAVGSSSKNASLILHQLCAESLFDAICDGTKINHSKPNPEVFIKAAEMLNLEPEQCLVVEDAASGLLAAHTAAMDCAMIGSGPWPVAPEYQLHHLTDLVLLIMPDQSGCSN